MGREISMGMDPMATTLAITTTSSSATATTPSILSTLTSFHAGYFRISLSLSGQALLWKTLKCSSPLEFDSEGGASVLHSSAVLHLLLWSLALVSLLVLSFLYSLRCLLRFPSVRAEFRHHVGVNYLFAPWISSLLLLQSSPFLPSSTTPYLLLCWLFSAPVLALDVKIYGQWITQGKRFLSMVANPTSQLSVIGNLVGARAAAEMGWKESAMCLFSLGIAHYLVLFVTLYQRFIGSDRLPVMLRPVFFLFFAAPSMASLAWDSISGTFDVPSKMLFFLSLFLFASLVSRPALFKRSMRKFNVAWWAYSFPLTVLALASTEYAQEVKGAIANTLMLCLAALSSMVSLALMLYTAFNTGAILPHDDPFMMPAIVMPSADIAGVDVLFQQAGSNV